MSRGESGSAAAWPLGIAPLEILVLNSLRRLLDLGPAMMRTISGWSGFIDTQLSPGETRTKTNSTIKNDGLAYDSVAVK